MFPAIWGTPGIADAHVVPPFVGPSDILKISETSEVSEVLGGGYRGGGGEGGLPPSGLPHELSLASI